MFDAGEDTTCHVDRRILSGDEPILLFVCESGDEPDSFVYHAMTGDSECVAENIAIVCLSHVVELDRTLNAVADLPVDWWATRPSPRDAWQTEPIPESERGEDPDEA